MAFRIEIQYTVSDARSVSQRAFFNSLIAGGKPVSSTGRVSKVLIVDCYTVDARLNQKQIQKAAELLTNPLVEAYRILPSETKDKRFRIGNFDFAVEISFLPGVTDNAGHTAKETIEDGTKYKFKSGENVYSSRVLFISGKLTRRAARKIAESLYNPLIQKAVIKSFSDFQKAPFPPNLPKVKLTASSKITKVDLNVSDEELKKLGKYGIKENNPPQSPLKGKESRRGPLALDLDYLHAIRDYFNKLGRKPTDVELEMLAQTWSEHCKHTIFADPIDDLQQGIFKTYIRGATEAIRKHKRQRDFCVSVFTDNSGAIIFNKDYLITHKVETHNTPSALDPFGGSVTGIVGVNRDCLGFGLGAKPIINTYGFCLAPPDDKTRLFRDKDLTQPLLSSRRIMDGVIAGINAGGNQSGIPTNAGFIYFDARYRGKPLVFAGTVGLIPRRINAGIKSQNLSLPAHIKSAKPNDLIVMIGGRVGLDGIHGATFSSESLDVHSPATAVQIGDPITQKKFSDAIVKEARDLGLYNSITDCGAGGLSSAVGEMAQQSNGCLVNLDKVPLKYPGLAPWQIWISESQERMVLAVPPKKWPAFQKLMKKRGVEATVIGKFTNDGKCRAKFGKSTVLDLDMDFLHNGRPIKNLKSQNASIKITNQKSKLAIGHRLSALSAADGRQAGKLKILRLLSSPNIASTAFVATQYDHEVQGGSVLKPLQGKGQVNADATITRPLPLSKRGVVLAQALYPSYSELNPYNMAACAIDTAIRNAVAAGAAPDYLALLDNFCWCSSDDPHRLWELKEAARACYDYAIAYGTPFISGKDSMFNDFKGYDGKGRPIKISILPTLLISAIGIINDITKAVSIDAKMPGDVIYILGETNDEMGGSEYEMMVFPSLEHDRDRPLNGKTPVVNPARNFRLYKSLHNAIQNNLIASAVSLHHGGLIVGISKTLIAGQLGADISLANLPGNWQDTQQALFSESQGRILVTVDPNKAGQFESCMADHIFAQLGVVTKQEKLRITGRNNKKIVDLEITEMKQAYNSTFQNF